MFLKTYLCVHIEKQKKNYVMIYVNPITRHSLTRCNEQQHIYNDQCK